MAGPRKYQTFEHAEVTVAGATALWRNVMTFEAPEDMTVIGCLVQAAMSSEPLEPTLGYEHSNVAGWVRILVNRASNVLPTDAPVENPDWDALAVNTLNDEGDMGETWAIAPFALASAGTNAGSAGFGSNDRVTLNPKTKRNLRRQDQIVVQMFFTNGGPDNAVIQAIVTGTLFTLT